MSQQQGNYFFKLNREVKDDWYYFTVGEWRNAGGDFMQRPSKKDLEEYFGDALEAVEWRAEPDSYGETYSKPD